MAQSFGMDHDQLKVMKALGRPFQIGTLYNYHEDAIIRETFLWDPDDVKLKVRRTKKRKSKIKIHLADDSDEKASRLGIDDHLLMSLMGNMIQDYRGASKYIDDRFEANQAAVCLHCRITTRREQLDPKDMTEFEFLCHNKILRQATHVVVAIAYGFQCFCVARQPVPGSEDKMDVEERLQQEMENWRQCLSDEKESAGNQQSQEVRYFLYSDLQPTREDEADYYGNCLKVMTADDRKAVPLTIWLCPLNDITSKAPRKGVGQEISKSVVESIHQLWSQLSDVQQLTEQVRTKVERLPPSPPLCDGVEFFGRFVDKYRHLVASRLHNLIGPVRRGLENESVLEKVVAVVRRSPFDPDRLSQWIAAKRNETIALEIVASLNNIRLVFDQQAVQQSREKRRVLVLALPNIGPGNSRQLEQMRLYLERTSKLIAWDEPLAKLSFPTETEWQELRSTVVNFLAFASKNRKEFRVEYMVSYGQRCDPSREIKLEFYEDGQLTANGAELPPRPDNLRVVGNQRGVITLQWDCRMNPWIDQYDIEYRESQSTDWHQVLVPVCKFGLGGLNSRLAYHFRVASVSTFGRSDFSSTIGPESVQAICDAPSVQLRFATNDSLSIQWSDPPLDRGISITGYQISYWPQGQDSAAIRITTNKRNYTLEHLASGTNYKIQVTAECGSLGFGSDAQPVIFRTNDLPDRVALVVRDVSTRSPQESRSGLDVFHVPLLEETLDQGNHIRRCQLGNGVNKFVRKTILVVGPTGSGKSTFINGLLNHILGVCWEDDFRFKLIQEQGKSQAHSQTQDVVAYDIFRMKGSSIDYSLTIVDTPGFGDTQGLERDKAIMEQLRQYFQCPRGIQELEAVCFLLPASLPRLTATQRYIYDSILSIFGKDIKDNIRLMVTFADNQEPPVLASIKESDIPYPSDVRGNPLHHKFNNCSLFSAKSQDPHDDVFTKMFFEMGTRSFAQFFADLSRMKTTSLSLTKEVLLERKRLEVVVEGLQSRIQNGLNRVEQFNQIQKVLAENDQQMASNKDFRFQVEFQVQETVDISRSGYYVSNCQNCKWTCHYPCKYASDADRRNCLAMDPDGKCRVCPSNCSWKDHFNQKFKYEWVTKKMERSSDEIRHQYEQSLSKKLTNQELKDQLARELEALEKDIVGLVNETYPSIKRLDEIALKPHPFTAPEYIDLIIKAEQQESHQPGSLHRITTLQKLKQMAEIQQKMINKQPVFQVSSQSPQPATN